MLPEGQQLPPTEPGATPPAVPPAGDPPTTPPADDTTAELERTRAALQAANREAADRRKKLEQYEKAEQDRKQAEMTELEKLQAAKEAAEKRAQDAEARATQRLIESAFVAEASRYGAKFPEDAYTLADKSGVTVDDDGKVVGVSEAVKALVSGGRLPMGTPQAPDLDGGSGGGQPQTRVTLTAEEEAIAKKMGISPQDYAMSKQVKSAHQPGQTGDHRI